MFVTNPSMLTLTDWADQLVMDLDRLGQFGRLFDEKDWKAWGAQFMNASSLPKNIPAPDFFDTWLDWAQRLVFVLGQ